MTCFCCLAENARILVSLPGNHPSGPGNASADSWQTGACAWSSDGRYFAWASSHRLIKIVPQSSTTATRLASLGVYIYLELLKCDS